MKIYLTLNEEKEKDKLIVDWLNCQYSKTGKIKELLFTMATNAGNMPVVSLASIVGRSEQETANSSNKGLDTTEANDGKKLDISEFL